MEPLNPNVPAEFIAGAPPQDGRKPASAYDDIYEGADAEPRHLREHFRVLWKYRWLCVTAFGLVFGLTLTVTMLQPRQYSAAVKIRVPSQAPIQLQLTENVLREEQPDQVLNGASVFTSTRVAMLKSRDLAERVIRSHHLSEDAAFMHRGGSGRPGLLEVASGLVKLFRPRRRNADPVQTAAKDEPAALEVPANLVNRYMSYLSVRDIRSTDLIEVGFTTPSARLSAFLASAHVETHKEAEEEARLATEVTAREFLQRHVREAQAKLEAAEAALNRFAAENPSVTLNQEEKIIAQRMAEHSSLLTSAQGQRIALETRHQFLAQPGGVAAEYFLDQPVVQKLRVALLQVATEQATLGTRLGPNHPEVRELATQEEALEERLGAEVAKQVSSLEAQLRAARLNEESLRKKLAEQEADAIELREVQVVYNLLKGEVDSSRALHELLVKQQKETLVTSQLMADNIRVVERAEVPTRPAKPNVPLNLALGLSVGLVFAVAVAFLCEHLDDSLRDSDEVEGLFHVPALAIVPNFAIDGANRPPLEITPENRNQSDGTLASPDLVVYHHPASIASEAFRVIRTAILYPALRAKPCQVILVTSTRAHEGKTVTTLNLALALGLSGARVLLIDADLRQPTCHRELGVENTTGLSSYLIGPGKAEDFIRSVEGIANVTFLLAGPVPPNPAELLGSERMRALLAWARERYDFILLDSPPALAVTDALVLAREADGVLFVVKGRGTPRELVCGARDRLMSVGACFLGVVVNNVDLRSGEFAPYYYSEYSDYVSRGTGTTEAKA